MKKKNNKEGRLDMYVYISMELGKLVLDVQEKFGISESQAKRYIGKISNIVAKK